jgi:hypothetical protein
MTNKDQIKKVLTASKADWNLGLTHTGASNRGSDAEDRPHSQMISSEDPSRSEERRLQ